MLTYDEVLSLNILLNEIRKMRKVGKETNNQSKEELILRIEQAILYSYILIGDYIIDNGYIDNKEKIKEIWDYLKEKLK